MITLEDTIKNYKGSKIAELSFLRENLNDSKSVFIIGERDGGEGVVGTVLNTPNINTIVCNDINNIEPNSILDRSINQWPDRVKFYCHDFNTIENINCDTLICISVLEHFGFIYNSYKCYVNIQNYGDDVILWNYDLLGLKKMIEIIKNNINCKAIITVPAGQPIMSGDLDDINALPYLRRYDIKRINLIRKLIISNNLKIKEKFYGSENFIDWYETEEIVVTENFHHLSNPISPNLLYSFVITK